MLIKIVVGYTLDMVNNPAHDLFSIGNSLCHVWVVEFSDTS